MVGKGTTLLDGLPYGDVEISSDIAYFIWECASALRNFLRITHARDSQVLRNCAAAYGFVGRSSDSRQSVR